MSRAPVVLDASMHLRTAVRVDVIAKLRRLRPAHKSCSFRVYGKTWDLGGYDRPLTEMNREGLSDRRRPISLYAPAS